jgi:hypothetical protein
MSSIVDIGKTRVVRSSGNSFGGALEVTSADNAWREIWGGKMKRSRGAPLPKAGRKEVMKTNSSNGKGHYPWGGESTKRVGKLRLSIGEKLKITEAARGHRGDDQDLFRVSLGGGLCQSQQ